jgi:hypothetical protein
MIVRHDGAERRPLWSPEAVPCCTGDEGRPLGAAMQVEASNHLKLLWSKAMVVSDQVSAMETNTSESLIKCRKRRDVIKTRGESLTWDKSGGHLLTVQAVAGMKAA